MFQIILKPWPLISWVIIYFIAIITQNLTLYSWYKRIHNFSLSWKVKYSLTKKGWFNLLNTSFSLDTYWTFFSRIICLFSKTFTVNEEGSKCVNIYINNSLCKIISSFDSKVDIKVFIKVFWSKTEPTFIKFYDLFVSSIL